MARCITAEACFIDVEACAFRIFDAIRKPLAIGQDGSDSDRVLHAGFKFATRGTVILDYVNFLPQFETWLSLWKLIAHRVKQSIPQWQENVEPCVRANALDAPNTGGNHSPR